MLKHKNMLSIVTDDGRVDLRGHAQATTPKQVKIVEPAAPNGQKPSNNAQAPGRGRQLRQGSSITEGSTADAPKKRTKAVTMDELDRRVENDALELLNMKKEIAEQQKLEVKNAMKVLMGIKKEYDAIKAENNTRQAQVNKVADEVLSLRGVDVAVQQSSEKTAEFCKDLTKQLASVEECVAAELRTLAMQKLMHDRLISDIHKLRIENGEQDFVAEKIKHNLNGVNNTLLLSKTELGDREFKLQTLRDQAKSRAKERGTKMQLLTSIVQDGMKSVSLIRSSFFDSSMGSPTSPRSGNTGDSPNSPSSPTALAAEDARFAGHHRQGNHDKHVTLSPIAEEGRGKNRGNVAWGDGVSKPPTSVDTAEEDFLAPVDSPRTKAQRLTLDEVSEMVERYSTRHMRIEKLVALEADLRKNLTEEKQKAIVLKSQIANAEAKATQLASTRQVYQDVEHQTRALNTARKDNEDWKEKDYRLKVNLVSLKRTIPRLLGKLTKTQHPVPTDLQLPDAVARLTTELYRYFKDITQTMLKDAKPEEMAKVSHEEDGDQSEMDKLGQLPGYQNVHMQLVLNMMDARPDNTPANVRIVSKTQSNVNGEASRSTVHPDINHHNSHRRVVERKKDELYGGPGVDSPVIDREMAKRISNLVFQRDGKGVVPVPVEKKKKEVKKKFVFKDIKIT